MMIAPKEDVVTGSGITIHYVHDSDEMKGVDHLLIVKAMSDPPVTKVMLHYRTSDARELMDVEMQRIQGSDHYTSLIPGQDIGKKVYYYFTAENEEGGKAVLPRKAAEGKGLYEGMYRLGFEGKVMIPLLWMHILLMISALILIIHGFYFALKNIITGEDFRKCYGTILAGMIVFTITGFPLGITVAKQAFGIGWSGIPFGWDITDNKTLVIFLYFLMILILGWKNFAKSEERFLKDKTFSLWSIIGTILTAILYLVPHSI